MRTTTKLNIKMVQDLFATGQHKTAYLYAAVTHLTAGVGYCSIQEFVDGLSTICSVSPKTAKRWLQVLKKARLIKIRRGTVHVLGKKALMSRFNFSQTYIQYDLEDLSCYSYFRDHTIQQVALHIQNRFRYSFHKHLKSNDATSLVNTGIIDSELGFVKSSTKTGCSISQVVKFLGVDKMTVSNALRGHTEKQVNYSYPIPGKVARTKYKDLIEGIISNSPRINPRFSFSYSKVSDSYRIGYAISSRVLSSSSLKRSRSVFPLTSNIV